MPRLLVTGASGYVGGEGAALEACGRPGVTGPRPRDCTLDVSRAQALLRVQLRGVRQVLG